MILSRNASKIAHFKLQIKRNIIPQTNRVKYLGGVILDNTLSWQTHIDKISNKRSRVCGMALKLKQLCPIIHFKTNLLWCVQLNSSILLINCGRTSKCHLYRIKVFPNRFLRASLFRKSGCPINALYSTFGVLKLDDMIDIEHSKFLFRFNNNMFPDCFKNYFVKLETIHHYHTRQKTKKDFFHTFARTEWERKMIQRKGLN